LPRPPTPSPTPRRRPRIPISKAAAPSSSVGCDDGSEAIADDAADAAERTSEAKNSRGSDMDCGREGTGAMGVRRAVCDGRELGAHM
jgi:hypothetical protein